ncbi:phosphatidylinositol 3-kinase [Entamoeba marina]
MSRTTFCLPKTPRKVNTGFPQFFTNKQQVRLIQSIDASRYTGMSYSSSLSPNRMIQTAQKRNIFADNSKKALCLYGLPFKFTDEEMDTPLHTHQFYNFCLTYGYLPTFQILNYSACESYRPINEFTKHLKASQVNYEIIGFEYLNVVKSIPDECQDFRRALARIREEEMEYAENNFDLRILEENEYVYIESEPPLSDTKAKLKINGRYGNDVSMKTIVHYPTDSIQTVIESLFQKLHIMKPDIFPPNAKASNFVLKVRGFYSFMVPYKRNGSLYYLQDFDYIRRCVHLNQPIDIVLFNRSQLYTAMWKPSEIEFMKHFNSFVGNDYWTTIQDQKAFISQKDVSIPFSVEIMKAEKIKHFHIKTKDDYENIHIIEDMKIYFSTSLHYGTRVLGSPQYSAVYKVNEGIVILDEPATLTFSVTLSSIPKETRLIISVYMTENPLGSEIDECGKKDVCLSTLNCKLVDYHGFLIKGVFDVGMWERRTPNPISMCCDNTSNDTCHLQYRLMEFNRPVKMDTFTGTPKQNNDKKLKLDAEHTLKFKAAVEADPLTPLNVSDILLLWDHRHIVMKTKPRSLARLVTAVDFTNQNDVLELHQLLNEWPLLEPTHALELLDFRFPDEKVRYFALNCLDAMKDHELVDFLPQLIQALKFELHHQSYLAFFLLRRALRNKNIIGHQFFWYLKAELHDRRVTERYGALIEAFLNGCQGYANELYHQVNFQNKLVSIANVVKTLATRDEQKDYLKSSLKELQLPKEMSLPIDSTFRIKQPVPNTGNVFSSKKKPLLLVLENVDPLGDDVMVIQKVGDDLRQDVLTLQLLRLMNNIWKSAGIDLRMSPYRCIATGNEIGMLELVKNSETYGAIIAADNRKLAITKEDVVTRWLNQQCINSNGKVTFEQAVENFIYSCAGYSVATYILGIGDRHSDNVMITRDGKFFHIDFGHFLGNFKSKFGVKRERTPFKFTHHFAHVMGGKGSPQFKLFEELCMRAFACIRKQGSLFIYLFRLMLATGIPELQSEADIEYVREAFMFDKKDNDAKEAFRQLIYQCLDDKSQTINDWIHKCVHYK